MWSILLKVIFAWLFWSWVLPSFSSTRGLVLFFAKLIALLLSCASLEVLLSWQFQVFTLHHMATHTSPVLWGNAIAYLTISLVEASVYYTRAIIQSEKNKRIFMETQLKTELNFLHAQLNPHFLFNTLNNLFSIALQDKNERLAKALQMLSGLMRYMLHDSSATSVPLKKEISHLQDFIGLARLRYTAEEADVHFEWTDKGNNTTVAPMLFLPLVENAFKHGVRVEEKSRIEISIHADASRVIFKSTNPKKKNDVSTVGGIGLENLRRRLGLLYPKKHQLEIEDSAELYTVRLILEQ